MSREEETEVTGRCFCGAVTYRASQLPEEVDTCYCSDCARAIGSPVTVWARFPTRHFRFNGADPVRFESSPGIVRTFCPRCGSSLTYHTADGEKVDVSAATLDTPERFPPTSDGPGAPPWLRVRFPGRSEGERR